MESLSHTGSATANLLVEIVRRILPSSSTNITVETHDRPDSQTLVLYLPDESLAYLEQNKGRLERSLRTLVTAVSMKTGERYQLAFKRTPK